MAGVGPIPKPASQRARRNKDILPVKILEVRPVKQPKLPNIQVLDVDDDGEQRMVRFVWPKITRDWWKMWAGSPLSADFTETDWAELQTTAFLHAKFWSGELKHASELRLRVAKFGATPEDRARLRIQFALAEEADEKRVVKGEAGSSRSRYEGLRLA